MLLVCHVVLAATDSSTLVTSHLRIAIHCLHGGSLLFLLGLKGVNRLRISLFQTLLWHLGLKTYPK